MVALVSRIPHNANATALSAQPAEQTAAEINKLGGSLLLRHANR